MFEIKNVSKQYNGEFALKNISLTIGKGMNFIVGASGSGKTTLLKIISGMEHDFDGEVFYYGKSVKTLSDTEKGYFYNHIFGFVWQDFHLLEERTVLENIMLPCYLNNVPEPVSYTHLDVYKRQAHCKVSRINVRAPAFLLFLLIGVLPTFEPPL